jgi:hypothetical protein
MSKKIINANKNLNLRMSAGSVIQRQEPEEWSSSDEETLDMMRPLVFVKLSFYAIFTSLRHSTSGFWRRLI